MKPIVMVAGVPGSGKTWVCQQLKDKYCYIPHDNYLKQPNTYLHVLMTATGLDKPVITECPFAERKMREQLEERGALVTPVFIVERPDVVATRYAQRESKATSKSNLTRASSIAERAKEWNAFSGTSEQVLTHLKELKHG